MKIEQWSRNIEEFKPAKTICRLKKFIFEE